MPDPFKFLAFIYMVRDLGLMDREGKGPLCVHCSAGIGRSGSFVLVDSLLELVSVLGFLPTVRRSSCFSELAKQIFLYNTTSVKNLAWDDRLKP